MFERYDFPAKRVIFFADYEAKQFGCAEIRSEHLLLGWIREDRSMMYGLLSQEELKVKIRSAVESRYKFPLKPREKREAIPLSRESRAILKIAQQEADRRSDENVLVEHLLLALVSKRFSFTRRLLKKHGVTKERVLKQLEEFGRRYVKSRALQDRAEAFIPGGVDSPVRAFGSVGGVPPFIVRGDGAHMWDADGNRYIDYVGSWGPLILGHAHLEVVEAIEQAARKGASFGANTPAEADLAEMVSGAMPAIELVRFVSSGTEATMSAIRLARAFTNRKYFMKFEGCYHGHADALLVKAGSGVATLGIPGSAGVPEEATQFTLALPFNDASAVETAFQKFPKQIACVIVEPVVGNMGCVAPQPGYLQSLREITQREGALLIFDEVMTGFRLAYGGAQQVYGIKPDLVTLGKIIGGGLPVGAYGGRREIMQMVAPLGPMYQAGTLSGNPLAMAAGLATLRCLKKRPEIYQQLEKNSAALVAGVLAAAQKAGVAMTANRVGSMFTWFFTDNEVRDWATAAKSDTKKFGAFHSAMLEQGVYLPPSQFEACFLSAAHGEKEIEQTVAAAVSALEEPNLPQRR